MEQQQLPQGGKPHVRIERVAGISASLGGVCILSQKELYDLIIPALCAFIIGGGIVWRSFKKEE